MKHAEPEEWNGDVVAPEAAVALEEQSATPCLAGERQIRTLQSVVEIADTDLRIEPPVFAVQSAKTLFRVLRKLDSTRASVVELRLGFDSFLTPASAGARSARFEERHLVYESSTMTLDLRLQAGSNKTVLKVVGQLFDADSGPVADIPAFLLEGDRIYSQDLSGPTGDFSLLGEVAGAPHLCLLVGAESLVELELPSVLDRLPSLGTH